MSEAWKDKRGWYPTYLRNRDLILANNQAKNGGRCTLRIEGVCTTVATQIHHVLGVKVNKTDPQYMAPSCAPCNNRIGDPAKHSPPHTGTTLFDD
jgi:hypothetical protein